MVYETTKIRCVSCGYTEAVSKNDSSDQIALKIKRHFGLCPKTVTRHPAFGFGSRWQTRLEGTPPYTETIEFGWVHWDWGFPFYLEKVRADGAF